MAIRALNLSEEWDFISQYDDDPEGSPTIFRLGLLDNRVRAWIQDSNSKVTLASGSNIKDILKKEKQKSGLEIADDEDASFEFTSTNNNIAKAIQTCMCGIRGVKNLIGANDNEVEYSTRKLMIGGKAYQVCSDQVLDSIILPVQIEISNEILTKMELTTSDIKN